MPAPWPLGNDLVDLRLAENVRSAARPRVVDRILAPVEREALIRAGNSPRMLWAHWAAKEAAYKSLRKTDKNLIFAHRRFVVRPVAENDFACAVGDAVGVVIHESRRIAVRWHWTEDWLHCLTRSETSRPKYRVRALRDCRSAAVFAELRDTYALPDASLAARLLALEMLSEEGVANVRIVRQRHGRRPGPPCITRDGVRLSGLDLSLSHDGRFAAAAIVTGTI